MTRKLALGLARVAGYHEDSARFVRLLVEERVNRQAMNAEWARGRQMKAAGVPCSCYFCEKAKGEQ